MGLIVRGALTLLTAGALDRRSTIDATPGGLTGKAAAVKGQVRAAARGEVVL